jgi:hypothetical protein
MYRRLSVGVLLCILFAKVSPFAQTAPAIPNDKTYVGFLDDAREEMVNWKPGVASQRVVRPAFERTSSGWKEASFSSLPNRMKWTIASDGRNLGQLESQANPDEGLTSFQTILTSASGVPNVGSASQEFAGLMALGPTKIRRPLVVVSKPYFKDPDGWKRAAKVTDAIAELVRKAFRREYPHVDRCKDEEIVQRNWKFPDSALAFPVAYTSNKHSFLIEASLNAGVCGFVDDPNDPLASPWFFVAPDGTVRRIGSSMSLLDAGDYDNDGKSELVFFLSLGENTDAFVLYDANLREQESLTWHYH